MKKFYLITICIMMFNILMSSATDPQSTSGRYSSKNIKKCNPSSEQIVDRNSVLQQSKGSNRFVHHSSMIPVRNVQGSVGGCIFTDDFDGDNDTTSLQARGYKTYYRGGGPPGTMPTWFQGIPSLFPSYNGPAEGYLASNYNSVTGANPIDNWLVLPSLNLNTSDLISFYSRSPGGSSFPDSLHVWYSAVGDSLPESTSWVLLGEFEVNVNDIWEYKSFTIPASSPNGRIAIRYAVIDGGPDGANSNYIGIDQLLVYTPSVNDGDLFDISSPVSGCSLTSTEPVTIKIKNFGMNPISGFDVSYSLDSGTAVVENISTTIAPGNSINYTFTALADLSATGTHSIDASIALTGDTNLCNDVKSVIVNNYLPTDPLTNAYTMGFESNEFFSDWFVEDADGDGVNWQLVNINPHSGVNCMRKSASLQDDNDWLFTGCLQLTGAASYTLDYWFKTFDLTAQCGIKAAIGNSQSSASMTQLLNDNAIPTDTTYQHSIVTFTVPNSGIYYIGFNAYSSSGGTSSIRLDDINLDNGTSIGIREKMLSGNVIVYPNPASGIFYVNGQAATKNISVDVFNVSGQKIYSSRLNNLNQQRIDLSNQSNGVYTIRITSDSFVENYPVIVNR